MRIKKSLFIVLFLLAGLLYQPELISAQQQNISAQQAFANPGKYENRQLYQLARQALASERLDEARLYALRLYKDGVRNPNLLNLLGVIEIQSRRPLIASEWFRRTLKLSVGDKVAHRYLSRLPAQPRPIPVDPERLADHFTEITVMLPRLLDRLTNPRLHFESVMKALERGQLYLALALSEEYEKKYPGIDGHSLTALCAWYLGRNSDALQIIENNISKDQFNPLMLFVKAMINDKHPGTSSSSYFKALYHVDQWQRAKSQFGQYARAFSNSPAAHIAKARILLDLYQTQEAGEILQQAALRDPGNPEIDLLFVDFFLQRGQNERAQRRLNQAFRRGYNLPAVNLTAGLFAIQAGRIGELNVLLNDARSSRPFSDPGAYAMYVSLLLMTDNTIEAKQALDEWEDRAPKRSMFAYMSAFYYFKTGENDRAIQWVRRGFEMNPDRLSIIQFMASFPAMSDAPDLLARIHNRLADAQVQGFERQNVPARPQQNSSSSSAQTYETENFALTLADNIDPRGREMLQPDLDEIYQSLSSRLGALSSPISVHFKAAEANDSTIAHYDEQQRLITVTTHYFDSDSLKAIIAPVQAMNETEYNHAINAYPSHLLAREIARYMIHQLIARSRSANSNTQWLQHGLSEMLAGSNLAIKHRLLLADESIRNENASLVSIRSLNNFFTEGYPTSAIQQTAKAQAYIMTGFLAKRSESLEKATENIMKMIEIISSGEKDFAATLEDKYKLSIDDFDRIWRDAAYWALSQGTVYEW